VKDSLIILVNLIYRRFHTYILDFSSKTDTVNYIDLLIERHGSFDMDQKKKNRELMAYAVELRTVENCPYQLITDATGLKRNTIIHNIKKTQKIEMEYLHGDKTKTLTNGQKTIIRYLHLGLSLADAKKMAELHIPGQAT